MQDVILSKDNFFSTFMYSRYTDTSYYDLVPADEKERSKYKDFTHGCITNTAHRRSEVYHKAAIIDLYQGYLKSNWRKAGWSDKWVRTPDGPTYTLTLWEGVASIDCVDLKHALELPETNRRDYLRVRLDGMTRSLMALAVAPFIQPALDLTLGLEKIGGQRIVSHPQS